MRKIRKIYINILTGRERHTKPTPIKNHRFVKTRKFHCISPITGIYEIYKEVIFYAPKKQYINTATGNFTKKPHKQYKVVFTEDRKKAGDCCYLPNTQITSPVKFIYYRDIENKTDAENETTRHKNNG